MRPCGPAGVADAAASHTQVDLLLTDLSPNRTGMHDVDEARQTDMIEQALLLARRHLRDGGTFLTKVLGDDDELVRDAAMTAGRNMIELHGAIANTFLPSAVKFHYQWNLRNLSSVMQGMLMSAIHGADQTGWLAETTLLDQLLEALGEAPETSSDADGEPSALMRSSADTAQRRANAAEVLVGIARGAPSAPHARRARKIGWHDVHAFPASTSNFRSARACGVQPCSACLAACAS